MIFPLVQYVNYFARPKKDLERRNPIRSISCKRPVEQLPAPVPLEAVEYEQLDELSGSSAISYSRRFREGC
jgi:hypothetical protein